MTTTQKINIFDYGKTSGLKTRNQKGGRLSPDHMAQAEGGDVRRGKQVSMARVLSAKLE